MKIWEVGGDDVELQNINLNGTLDQEDEWLELCHPNGIVLQIRWPVTSNGHLQINVNSSILIRTLD